MRQPMRTAQTQLELFATRPQIQLCPREIDPRVIPLLARLLRQHVNRKGKAAGEHPEGGHE